jgi:hypothetical protein
MVAAVSNQRLKEPCVVSGSLVGCGPPLDHLATGGMFIEWWENGFPTWSFDEQSGTPLTEGGLRAKMQETLGAVDECTGLGGDKTIRVIVERPSTQDNYFLFVACMRGPGLDTERSTALAILTSARFKR